MKKKEQLNKDKKTLIQYRDYLNNQYQKGIHRTTKKLKIKTRNTLRG